MGFGFRFRDLGHVTRTLC